MKKLLVVLVVVALLAGGGYAWWYFQQNQKAETPESVSDEAGTVASEPSPVPAQATELATAGCRVMLPSGWLVDEEAPETRIVPGGQAVVLRQGAGQLPLLVIGRMTPQTLQSVDPKSYPAAFIKKLQQRLTSLQPVPTVSHAGDLQNPPKLFVEAQELVAQGSFPELGNQAARGRFIAGTAEAGEVYLISSFVPAGAPAEAEVDQIIASLEALPGAVPPAAGPETPTVPAPGPTATPAPAPGSPATAPAPAAPAPAPAAPSAAPGPARGAPAGEPTNEPPTAASPPAAPGATAPTQPGAAPPASAPTPPRTGTAPAGQPRAGAAAPTTPHAAPSSPAPPAPAAPH